MAIIVALLVFYFAFRHIHFNVSGKVSNWYDGLKDERDAYYERQKLRAANDWFKKNNVKLEEEV
jgi:hypothetical protein